jgi:hypothetical protein
MLRFTDWWGIRLISENEDERRLLLHLETVSKDEADRAYEDGAIEMYPIREFFGLDWFERDVMQNSDGTPRELSGDEFMLTLGR